MYAFTARHKLQDVQDDVRCRYKAATIAKRHTKICFTRMKAPRLRACRSKYLPRRAETVPASDVAMVAAISFSAAGHRCFARPRPAAIDDDRILLRMPCRKAIMLEQIHIHFPLRKVGAKMPSVEDVTKQQLFAMPCKSRVVLEAMPPSKQKQRDAWPRVYRH